MTAGIGSWRTGCDSFVQIIVQPDTVLSSMPSLWRDAHPKVLLKVIAMRSQRKRICLKRGLPAFLSAVFSQYIAASSIIYAR